jgi:rhodanese-related sulfurtransferase
MTDGVPLPDLYLFRRILQQWLPTEATCKKPNRKSLAVAAGENSSIGGTTMAEQTRQDQLLHLYGETASVITQFITTRSESEKSERGTSEEWAAKDVLAQVGFWMDYMAERMGYFVRGETAPQEVDFDELFRTTFDKYVDWLWEKIVDYTWRAHARLVEATERFPDKDFAVRNSYAGIGGGPLWGEVQANGFVWPLEEFEKYYQRRGETAMAAVVRARLEPVVGEPEPIVCDLIAPADLSERRLQAAAAPRAAPLVVDVRAPKEYAAGHVAGAINIPLEQVEIQIGELPADQLVVTYCNMHHPGHSRGEEAAALLSRHGIQAMALQGGFPAWKEAELPQESTAG